MTESDYWVRLEYLVTRELSGMQEQAFRPLWCDGFVPERYIFDDPVPRITGRAWIGAGSKEQHEWAFTLHLEESTGTHNDISWSALLPSDGSSGWLTVDIEGQCLGIAPRVAGA